MPKKPDTHLVKCTGDAHNNPMIDHCGLCAPNWGWIELPTRFKSLEEFREARAREYEAAREEKKGKKHAETDT